MSVKRKKKITVKPISSEVGFLLVVRMAFILRLEGDRDKMKLIRSQRFWIAVCAVIFLGSLFWCFFILNDRSSGTVVIKQDGKTVMTLDLNSEADQTIEFEFEGRKNVLEISGKRIHMLSADCPDHVCIHTGWLKHGLPIVCLPNKLSVEFADSGTDANTR